MSIFEESLMDNALCCSRCNDVVLKSFSNGELKLRSKVIVFNESGAFAVCKGCNTEIPIPITLDTTLMKGIKDSKKLRLYVKNS